MRRAAGPRAVLWAFTLAVGLTPSAGALSRDTDGAVHVTWSASPSRDVVGYHVYRSSGEPGHYTRLTTVPISEQAYIDRSVRDGEVFFYAASAVDASGRESALAAADAGVVVQLDTTAPLVLTHAPVDQQGLPADPDASTRAVPADSSPFVRLWDDTGVDADTVILAVDVNGQPFSGTTTVHPVLEGNTTDLFARFLPAHAFPQGADVRISVMAQDLAGNTMPAYAFAFRVATVEQQAAAAAAAPETLRRDDEDGTRVLQAGGVTVLVPAEETQVVTLGATQDTGAWVNLDRVQFYTTPITVQFALGADGLAQAGTLEVLRYDDASHSWTVATVGDGWLVSLNVVGETVQIEVAHSAAIAMAFGT